jgi:hypothetical protein
MERKHWIGPAILALALMGGAISGCVSTGDGHGVQAIEQMSELDFSKWKLYLTLGTKIGANRLLAEGAVTAEELEIAATALETLRDQTVVPGATSLIQPALREAGLTNDEVELLLLIVEQELLSRGALEWVNPETGLFELSPRTKDLLTVVAGALRSATSVTSEEVESGQQLEAEFQGQIIR